MDAAISVGSKAFSLPTMDRVDPLVSLALRYQDLIEQIESSETDDNHVDRLMCEAMDIEAVMLRVQPVTIEGYVASIQFTRHFR